MPDKIEIHVKYLKVITGGDGNDYDDAGEIGYEVRLNNVVILHRWGNEIQSVANNTNIWIDKRFETTEPSAALYWHVWDVDTFADDDAGNRTLTYATPNLPQGEIRDRMSGDGVDVELVYEVNFIPDVIFGPGTNVPQKRTSANLRGVVLYEHWFQNRRDQGAGIGLVRKPASQVFGPGFYNLPVPIAPSGEGPLGNIDNLLFPQIQPNMTSSVRVGTGFHAIVYTEFDRQGQSLRIDETIDEMPTAPLHPIFNWNDRIKSIEVFPQLFVPRRRVIDELVGGRLVPR
jgi:hypothetical protein